MSTPRDGAHQRVNALWDGAFATIKALKDSADWKPQLKASLGGVVAFLEIAQNFVRIPEEIEKLRNYVEKLSTIVEVHRDMPHQHSIGGRIESLINNLDEQTRELTAKQSRSVLFRLFQSQSDPQDIVSRYQKIMRELDSFLLDTALNIERIASDLLKHATIHNMLRSKHAEYNVQLSGVGSTRRSCMPDTSEQVLELLSDWVQDPNSQDVFILTGMAGMGKTTISYSFCESVDPLMHSTTPPDNVPLLGSSFFCHRELDDCRRSVFIIPTIAFQLARFSGNFAIHLIKALKRDSELPSKPFDLQFKYLLSAPWKAAVGPNSAINRRPVTIVIDALDECEDGMQFLEQLLRTLKAEPLRGLKFLLTGRPEKSLSDRHTSERDAIGFFRLHDLTISSRNTDIKKFISMSLVAAVERIGVTSANEIDALVRKSSGLWIYASTVISYVLPPNPNVDSKSRLSEILSSSTGGSSDMPTRHLDQLYNTIVFNACKEFNDVETRQFECVLDALTTSREPLSLKVMTRLLDVPHHRLRSILASLSSVYRVDDDTHPVLPLHASFTECMLDPSRSTVMFKGRLFERHICDHIFLATRCLQIMVENGITTQLEVQELCEQLAPAYKRELVDCIRRQKLRWAEIPAHLEYSCGHWNAHLTRCSPSNSALLETLGSFVAGWGIATWTYIVSRNWSTSVLFPKTKLALVLTEVETWLGKSSIQQKFQQIVTQIQEWGLSVESESLLSLELETCSKSDGGRQALVTYGPVLSSTDLYMTSIELELNPILMGRGPFYLNFNLESGDVSGYSLDETGFPLVTDEPATFPLVSEVIVITERSPWCTVVKDDKGVTVHDICTTMWKECDCHSSCQGHDVLSELTLLRYTENMVTEAEFSTLQPRIQEGVRRAAMLNSQGGNWGAMFYSPPATPPDRIERVNWLRGRIFFDMLKRDDDYTKSRLGFQAPNIFIMDLTY